jgi:chromosomal replication initiation ATPase DnaA
MTTQNKLNYYAMPGVLIKTKPDTEEIIQFVCKEMNVKYKDALSKDRSRILVLTRNMCYAILKTYVGSTVASIGRLFFRDHTTVLHGLRMHQQDMRTNDIYEEQFEEIRFLLKLYLPTPKHLRNAKSIRNLG